MRTLFGVLLTLWVGLTVIAVKVVAPREDARAAVIALLWRNADVPAAAEMERRFAEAERAAGRAGESFAELNALPAGSAARREAEARFAAWYDGVHVRPLAQAPRLVWSTDSNPARLLQMEMFRRWHLAKYGEPCDVTTDPAGRDTASTASVTKPVIQSLGGAGADILETYGPKQLQAMVSSGIALDITEEAAKRGVGYQRCFTGGWSSFVQEGKQYGFPANVGYTVLFYHKDLAADAGVTIPTGGWTIAQLEEVARKLTVESASLPGGKRWGIVGMEPWPMALSNGGRFFSADGTECIYNSPETIAGLQAFQDLMFKEGVSPTPAETASMAAAGGFMGGANNGLYFAAKLCAMTIGGRWEYVTYAQANLSRAIRPALLRAAEGGDEKVTARVARILATLEKDVLIPLPEEDYEFIRQSLTEADRAKLLHIGVAHTPTVSGKIWYTDVGARVAMVNRASPHREECLRFIEFLGSAEYNEQINQTFDSICGVIEYCTDEDGISGPPEALPGLEDFDSKVFVEAMEGAESQQLSPFIGPERLGYLVGQVLDQLRVNQVSAAEAARLIEDRVNGQMRANIARDAELRAKWEGLTGRKFDGGGAAQ